MNDLIAFLEVRLDEDERAAREALLGYPLDWDGTWPPPNRRGIEAARWEAKYHEVRQWPGSGRTEGAPRPVASCGPANVFPATHIARHDPKRVLADVEARRRLLAFLVVLANERDLGDAWWRLEQSHPAPLRLLAAPYADHPDYRSEWAT